MIANATPAHVLVLVLRAVGLGTASGDWKATYGLMPSDEPVRRLSVMTTSPFVHGRDRDGQYTQHYGVQVLVRADDMDVGLLKAHAVINRLCQVTPATKITVAGGGFSYDVEHVVLASGPVYMGTQENDDAEVHAVNLLFTCREY